VAEAAPQPAIAAAAIPVPFAPQAPREPTPSGEIAPLRADRDAAAKPRAATMRPQAPAEPSHPPHARAATTQIVAQRDAAPPAQMAAPSTPPPAAPPPVQDTLASATPHAAASVAAETASARDAAPATLAARIATPAAQVAQQIIRRVDNGATHFELRLEPPELGRVDVRLEMSRDHRVTALIAADETTTLNQLVRAAREIEWALQSAGLELSQAGLSFDFADRGAAGSGERDPGAAAPALAGAADEPAAQAPVRALLLERWRGARVDLTA
jgi:hypothetical protein